MTTAEPFIENDKIPEGKPWTVRLGRMIQTQPLGAAGAIVVLLMIFAAIFAEYITPYDPENSSYEFMLVGPNADFWMGTDQFGRDIFSRVIFGARTALMVGFICAQMKPTINAVRAPNITREKMSRPNWSVPIQKSALGPTNMNS